MEQKLFECYIGGGTYTKTQELNNLLREGWMIVTAIFFKK